MSWQAVADVAKLYRGRPSSKLLLMVIAECENHEGGGAYPSIDTLAERSCISTSTIHRRLTELKDGGFLHVEYKAGPKGCNVYRTDMTPCQSDTVSNVTPNPVKSEDPPCQIADTQTVTMKPSEKPSVGESLITDKVDEVIEFLEKARKPRSRLITRSHIANVIETYPDIDHVAIAKLLWTKNQDGVKGPAGLFAAYCANEVERRSRNGIPGVQKERGRSKAEEVSARAWRFVEQAKRMEEGA